MARKKKRWYAGGLAVLALVGVILLSMGFVQKAHALPGYSCNPSPGHGNPGCHVTASTSPPATSPPTTARPSSGTKPRTGTASSAAGTATTVPQATTTLGMSTTTTDPGVAVAGVGSGRGDGTGVGGALAMVWTATVGGLAALALIALAATGIKRAGERRRARVAAAKAAGPVRFVLAERLAHWVYALCFVVAGITGALMWIPSTERWMAEAGVTVSKYHGYVGLSMVLIPLVIFLVLDRRRLAQNRRELDSWDANDRQWLWQALSGGMFRGRKMPPQRRFNAGQKVNTHLVAALALGFVVTGILLLVRLHLPVWLVPGILFAHQVLAVSSGVLLLGHVGMALFTRHGRGGLRAMVNGVMPARFAREGHSIWYAEWLRQNGAERG